MSMETAHGTDHVDRPRRLYQRPVLGILSVLVLYIVTATISEFLARGLLGNNESAGILLRFGILSMLVFIVIPLLLKLPRGSVSFSTYLEAVGLRTRVPISRIVLLALSCYVIFAVIQLSGSLIYYSTHPGRYSLDLSRHSLLESGSLVSGVFEEIVLRGVIVAILLGAFPKVKAVMISAAVFACLHLLNMLNPENTAVWVLAQTVWAFGLGLMYAYLFAVTQTIWPPIILHYLINGMVGVWMRGLDGKDLTSALFGIPFFGLVPAGLAMVWGRFLWKYWESTNPQPER